MDYKQGRCPPKQVTVPPTFHPLPSLLNVIDFKSETDKTAHKAIVRFSECQQLHAITDCTIPTRTCPPDGGALAPALITSNMGYVIKLRFLRN